MKWPVLLLACCSLGSSPLLAQDVRVRLFTSAPPKTITVIAKVGDLRWRSCPVCDEHSVQRLVLDSIAKESAGEVAGNSAAGEKDLFVSGNYQLTPSEGPVFSASFPLHIERHSESFSVIVTMPLEQYVQGVLAAESGDDREPESMKAMAVAVRTYAQKFRNRHAQEGFDFCDTTHCQVMHRNAANQRGRSAQEATNGEILKYQDAPAATYYHQDCGGSIAAAEEAWPGTSAAYLTGHPDSYCLAAGGLKWEKAIGVGEIDRALRDGGITPPHGWTSIEISSKTPSGRAHRLNLRGGNPPSFILAASSVRFAVGRALGWNKIRSDLYDIRISHDQIIFSGRGAGHGVGLCQAGASEMAREGKTYREILSFYFPGTQVASPQAEKWQSRIDERFELLSTNPESDAAILADARRILKESEEKIGWQIPFRIRLQVYSSLDKYRDATGRPGWVAAFTRNRTIRLQPIGELRRRMVLESTLRHELFHLLVDVRAKQAIPAWFREGLVLSLSNPDAPASPVSTMTLDQIEMILQHSTSREEMEKAYAAAQRRVAELIERFGLQKVCSWLSSGIPSDVSASLVDPSTLAPKH
jgi:stage II sporulation protein D